jgi:uncharacterized phage-associated protein
MDLSNPPYDSRVIANSFLDIALKEGDVIDPMKLLKLVYIAHGWYLALTGEPLIRDSIEAWKHGPVIPKLYDAIRKFGARPISEYYTEFDFDELTTYIPTVQDEETRKFLNVVWNGYGTYSGIELSAMTHKEGTPWREVYSPDKRHIVIPMETIRSYYESLLNDKHIAAIR